MNLGQPLSRWEAIEYVFNNLQMEVCLPTCFPSAETTSSPVPLLELPEKLDSRETLVPGEQFSVILLTEVPSLNRLPASKVASLSQKDLFEICTQMRVTFRFFSVSEKKKEVRRKKQKKTNKNTLGSGSLSHSSRIKIGKRGGPTPTQQLSSSHSPPSPPSLSPSPSSSKRPKSTSSSTSASSHLTPISPDFSVPLNQPISRSTDGRLVFSYGPLIAPSSPLHLSLPSTIPNPSSLTEFNLASQMNKMVVQSSPPRTVYLQLSVSLCVPSLVYFPPLRGPRGLEKKVPQQDRVNSFVNDPGLFPTTKDHQTTHKRQLFLRFKEMEVLQLGIETRPSSTGQLISLCFSHPSSRGRAKQENAEESPSSAGKEIRGLTISAVPRLTRVLAVYQNEKQVIQLPQHHHQGAGGNYDLKMAHTSFPLSENRESPHEPTPPVLAKKMSNEYGSATTTLAGNKESGQSNTTTEENVPRLFSNTRTVTLVSPTPSRHFSKPPFLSTDTSLPSLPSLSSLTSIPSLGTTSEAKPPQQEDSKWSFFSIFTKSDSTTPSNAQPLALNAPQSTSTTPTTPSSPSSPPSSPPSTPPSPPSLSSSPPARRSTDSCSGSRSSDSSPSTNGATPSIHSSSSWDGEPIARASSMRDQSPPSSSSSASRSKSPALSRTNERKQSTTTISVSPSAGGGTPSGEPSSQFLQPSGTAATLTKSTSSNALSTSFFSSIFGFSSDSQQIGSSLGNSGMGGPGSVRSPSPSPPFMTPSPSPTPPPGMGEQQQQQSVTPTPTITTTTPATATANHSSETKQVTISTTITSIASNTSTPTGISPPVPTPSPSSPSAAASSTSSSSSTTANFESSFFIGHGKGKVGKESKYFFFPSSDDYPLNQKKRKGALNLFYLRKYFIFFIFFFFFPSFFPPLFPLFNLSLTLAITK